MKSYNCIVMAFLCAIEKTPPAYGGVFLWGFVRFAFLLFVICSLLFALCSLLFVICSLLFALCYLLFVICSLLFALCYLLFVICSLLFALCSLFFVISHLMNLYIQYVTPTKEGSHPLLNAYYSKN